MKIENLITRALVSCGLLMISLLMAAPAQAHKVSVFAYAENDQLKGEGYFAGGDKAQGCAVEVHDAQGRLVASGKTDAKGEFALPLPAAAPPLTIVLVAGQGHRGDYTLTAAELNASAPDGQAAAASTPAPPPSVESAPAPAGVGAEELERVVNQALDKKLAPLTAQVAKLAGERGVSLQDVIGGLGYILGLMGIAAYLKARKG